MNIWVVFSEVGNFSSILVRPIFHEKISIYLIFLTFEIGKYSKQTHSYKIRSSIHVLSKKNYLITIEMSYSVRGPTGTLKHLIYDF